MISRESRFMAGFLLVVLPSVLYGGLFLLSQLVDNRSGYMANPLRQNLFRAGHAHAGVLLVFSLIALRYVDEATLSPAWKWIVRAGIPSAAIFLPGAFFFSCSPLRPLIQMPSSTLRMQARLYWAFRFWCLESDCCDHDQRRAHR